MQPTKNKIPFPVVVISGLTALFGLNTLFAFVMFGQLGGFVPSFVLMGICSMGTAIGLMKMKKWGVYFFAATSLVILEQTISNNQDFSSVIISSIIFVVFILIYFVSIFKKFS